MMINRATSTREASMLTISSLWKSLLAIYALSNLQLAHADLLKVPSINANNINHNNNNNNNNGKNGASSNISNTRTRIPRLHHPPSPATMEEDFWNWCRNVMGIESKLEIHTFDYYDHVQALTHESADALDFPLVPVRGLASSTPISPGDLLITVPRSALLSVSTWIDADPSLSAIMGHKVRQEKGWSQDDWYEIPLLAMALLHHVRLQAASPYAPYIQLLLATPTDKFPFLWNATQLQTLPDSIRKTALQIQSEMTLMYDTVLTPLIQDHPDTLGPALNETDWYFSYPSFTWAFALVNSRHWSLPLPPLPAPPLEGESLGQPPANMPVQDWLDQGGKDVHALSHQAFLAPVADLLNYGPPCTKSKYNIDKRAFEVIATCSFAPGQEVTFWYSDECVDVMVAVYGFTHLMVPPCPSLEEYRRQSETFKARAQDLQDRLLEAYERMDQLEAELEVVTNILEGCESCDDQLPPRSPRVHHEHVRGGLLRNQESLERHGIRKRSVHSRKSEF
jgi:SET domain